MSAGSIPAELKLALLRLLQRVDGVGEWDSTMHVNGGYAVDVHVRVRRLLDTGETAEYVRLALVHLECLDYPRARCAAAKAHLTVRASTRCSKPVAVAVVRSKPGSPTEREYEYQCAMHAAPHETDPAVLAVVTLPRDELQRIARAKEHEVAERRVREPAQEER